MIGIYLPTYINYSLSRFRRDAIIFKLKINANDTQYLAVA